MSWGLLQAEDLPDDTEGLVWVEYKVRVLIDRKDPPTKSVIERFSLARTVDFMSSTPVGVPAVCECGKVAVKFNSRAPDGHGAVYPFGQERYSSLSNTKWGQYCPHCDGGEDIG